MGKATAREEAMSADFVLASREANAWEGTESVLFGSQPYGNCGKRLLGLGSSANLVIDFILFLLAKDLLFLNFQR